MNRRPGGFLAAASVLLLLVCCSQHAEGRANKGPGHYRPRLADHMKAAGRMVYVAAQDDPSPHHHGPPHRHPVHAHAAPKHAAAHPHKSAAAAAASGGTAPAAVKKDDQANKQDAAAHAAAVKAATGKTLVKVPTSDSKPEARPAAAAAAAGSSTVAAALLDIGNAPVHFHAAGKPAEEPPRQFTTPKPVLKADQQQQHQQEQKPAAASSAGPQAPSNPPVNSKNPAGQAGSTPKLPAGSDKQPNNASIPAVAGSSHKQADKPAEGAASTLSKEMTQQQVPQPKSKNPAGKHACL